MRWLETDDESIEGTLGVQWLRSSRQRWRAMLGFVVLLTVQVACDRNIEPFEPGEEAKPPDLARIFPAPIGEQMGEGDATGGAGGPVARGALPPSRNEGAGAASPQTGAAAAAPIRGEIELAAEHATSRPPGAILFVIARPVGVTRGPPLAVLRIPDPTFPLPFEIGPANVMIPSMQFAGEIALSARLDADGNAMTRGADDISSPVAAPLEPGAEGVRLVLSERSISASPAPRASTQGNGVTGGG